MDLENVGVGVAAVLANVGDNFGSLGTEPLPKVGEPELLGDSFPIPVEGYVHYVLVPASPGLLATDRFEPGSGIDVSADAPEFVTPHEDLVGDHEGSAYIPSDGTACGAPLKSDRAIIPLYSSVSLLSRFDNMSNEPVGSSMAPLPDLPEDAVVFNWLLGGAGADMEVTVFSIDGREARSEIGATVIDAWACLLNLREILRDSAVPTRFFASTFTTLHTVVDTSHSREQRVKWFWERLLVDFKSCPHSDITKADMEGSFTCHITHKNNDNEELTYKVQENGGKQFEATIQRNDKKTECTCKKFNRLGILCMHVLLVFKQEGLEEIPGQYIVTRWTRDACTRPMHVIWWTTNTTTKAANEAKSVANQLWNEFYNCMGLANGWEEKMQEMLTTLQQLKTEFQQARQQAH
nr:protein FAR1-RELATED SEQUENCE 5-like [Ipomoea batatas]